jgi:hypothetical protein
MSAPEVMKPCPEISSGSEGRKVRVLNQGAPRVGLAGGRVGRDGPAQLQRREQDQGGLRGDRPARLTAMRLSGTMRCSLHTGIPGMAVAFPVPHRTSAPLLHSDNLSLESPLSRGSTTTPSVPGRTPPGKALSWRLCRLSRCAPSAVMARSPVPAMVGTTAVR